MPYYVVEVMTARQWRCACGFETRIFWTFENEGDEPAPMIVPENVREAKREHMLACQGVGPAELPSIEAGECPHGVVLRHGCRECVKDLRDSIAMTIDTGEIPTTAAGYTAWREHIHSTLRTPGWEAPELRALGEDD